MNTITKGRRKRLEKEIELKQAELRGETIQFKTAGGEWVDVHIPNLAANIDKYRIKPKAIKRWVALNEKDAVLPGNYSSELEARGYLTRLNICGKVICLEGTITNGE